MQNKLITLAIAATAGITLATDESNSAARDIISTTIYECKTTSHAKSTLFETIATTPPVPETSSTSVETGPLANNGTAPSVPAYGIGITTLTSTLPTNTTPSSNEVGPLTATSTLSSTEVGPLATGSVYGQTGTGTGSLMPTNGTIGIVTPALQPYSGLAAGAMPTKAAGLAAAAALGALVFA